MGVAKDRKKMKKALKTKEQAANGLKKQQQVEQYAKMQIAKEEASLNKWSAEKTKTAKFKGLAGSGKGFKQTEQQVQNRIDRAKSALKVAKAVVQFSKFKTIADKQKDNKATVTAQKTEVKLAKEDKKLGQKKANAALKAAKHANKPRFTWQEQKKFWQKAEAKKKVKESEIVVAAAKAAEREAVSRYE